MEISTIRSEGYCFQIEMTRRAIARGGSVAEIPITFIERAHGVSKMSLHDRARSGPTHHRLGSFAPDWAVISTLTLR
jgi:hypothetical protein